MNRMRDFDRSAVKRERIRLIFFPFLLLTSGGIALCSVLYRYFAYERGMADFGVGIVVIAALAPLLIRRRMNLIERKSEPANRLLFLLCTLWMLIPALCLQSYIDKSAGKLTRLDDLTEIDDHPPTCFYTVEALPRTTRLILDFTYYNEVEKGKKQRLDTYCITPLYSGSQSDHIAWLGRVYRSGTFDPDRRQEILDSFVPASVERFEADVLQPFRYLERIILTGESGYYRALGISSIPPREITLLVPHTELFDKRGGNSLYYALLAYAVFAGLFFTIVLFSPFNEKRLRCFLTGERYRDTPAQRPSKVVEGKRVANDKLIVVRGIPRPKIERDLKEVCDLYNADGGRMYPDLRQTGDTEFVVTFPCDIDFEPFCYLINYLCYPVSGGERAQVTGWAKAAEGDPWITGSLPGKRLMLYVPEEDKEYDNVYVTTEDGECYKFGFDGKTISLSERFRPYQKPLIIKQL